MYKIVIMLKNKRRSEESTYLGVKSRTAGKDVFPSRRREKNWLMRAFSPSHSLYALHDGGLEEENGNSSSNFERRLKIYAPQTVVWRLLALFAIPWPGYQK